ncbi:FtsK/SpoIIIE family DNA translocase, partial [Chelatococcus sambhunathii]
MRTSRHSLSQADELSDAMRRFFARRAAEISGLGLVALALAFGLALATWSVEDPSLTHATNGPVKNLLGPLGAVIADLGMQILGMGAIVFVVPVVIWGMQLMGRRRLERLALRIGLWLAGTAAAAAVASAMPATTSWPLPSGLGGVVGDGLLFGLRSILGLTSGPGAAIITLVYAGIAILALTAACGFGFPETADDDDEEELAPRRASRRAQADDFEDEGADEPGWGIVSLGAVVHGFMTLKSAIVRRLAARRPAQAHAGSPAAPQVPSAPRTASRREPRFEQAPAVHDVFDGAAGFGGHDPAEAPFAVDDEAYAPRTAGPAVSRVVPPPPAPKPGKRLAREAQPSFLDDGEDYQLPPLALLAEPKKNNGAVISPEALEQNAALLESTLEDFGVKGEIINAHPGPVVTLYELEPAPGTKSSRVISLADDIARSMSAVSARVAVVPGRNAIGIELPNARRETVYLRELLASQDFEQTRLKLALCLGKTIGGEPVIAELARMPHLLVAGTTGSGKSVAINTMILSLLYRLRPEECRLIMVDPKMLELSIYDGIPHLLTPVVTDPKKAVVALKWAVREMEERYKKMSKLGVRNIDGFNARIAEARAKGEVITRTVQTGFDRETGEAVYEDEVMDLAPLPYIVVIVDEMADLMMVAGKEIEGTIQRLAQMARAAGIHVVLATQRPSVDVITGTIKANFPTRISFQVTSKIDSRTILGEQGAEQLLGQGDMLYMAGGGRITRVHGPFVSDEEVEKVVAHLKAQGRPQY